MIQDVVVEVHRALEEAAVEHAFGGALALVQYAEPRGTIDIDVNIESEISDAGRIIEVLHALRFDAVQEVDDWLPMAGTRFERIGELATLDVFFAFDPYHAEVIARARHFPFASSSEIVSLPFLAANDLVVMKLSFNRPKDWVDIDAMIAAGTPLDAEYITEHLVRFRGSSMYPRTARLRQLLDTRE